VYRSTGKGTTVYGIHPIGLTSLELRAYSLRSSFAIQVGKTAQNVRVFPSTASTTTWVVENVGCPSDAPSNCEDSRGGVFNKNTSLTWVPNSIFEIGIEENLGFDVFGDFGFDTVTLGWLGSGGPTVEHSIVAGIGDTTLTWLGVLGLNPRPTNFSTFVNNPQVSFIQALRNQNAIPSVSWSYTAGASYRMYHLRAKIALILSLMSGFNKVFGSLVIGGYDTSRFTYSNMTFPFYEDISRDLLVGIQKITSDATTTPLLSDGVFAFIDYTIPYIYLPLETCQEFEKTFGLTWNSTRELYLVNSTLHSSLLKTNPNITFTLGTTASGGDTVDIILPYAAFDLNVSWPYVSDTSYYYPLKRATNSTQYTLGRAFLQEAYLIADYERSNFSIFPCKWEANAQSTIVAIPSINDTTTPNNTTTPATPHSAKSSISVGLIVGIVIGALVVIAIAASLIWYFRRRLCCGKPSELDADETARTAAAATTPQVQPLKAMPGGELDSTTIHELPGHHKFGVLEAPGGVEAYAKISEMEGEVPAQMHRGRVRGVFEMDAGMPVMPPAHSTSPSSSQRLLMETQDLPASGHLEAMEMESRFIHTEEGEVRLSEAGPRISRLHVEEGGLDR
jgi:hypothetical protein